MKLISDKYLKTKIPSKNSNKTITLDCSIRVYHMSFTYNYTQSKIYYSYGTDILHFIVILIVSGTYQIVLYSRNDEGVGMTRDKYVSSKNLQLFFFTMT